MIGEGRCLGSVYVGRCCKDLWRRRRRRRHVCSVQVEWGATLLAGRLSWCWYSYTGGRTGRYLSSTFFFFPPNLQEFSSSFFSCCEHSSSCFLDSVLRSGFAAAQVEDNFEEEVQIVFDFGFGFMKSVYQGDSEMLLDILRLRLRVVMKRRRSEHRW